VATYDGVDAGLPVPLTDAATINIDASLGKNFAVTLGGNRTFAKPTNGYDGQVIVLIISQDNTGSRTGTFTPGFVATTDTGLPTLSTTAGKTDYFAAIYSLSHDKWYAHAVNKGAA